MVVDTMRAGATGKDKWQAKSLRSTFGNQCMSQLPTSPSCGFGSAVREATDRVRARWAPPYVPAQFCVITYTVLCCCFPLLHRTYTLVCRPPLRSVCCYGCADVCVTRCGQSKLPIKGRQQLSRSHLQSAGQSTC